MPASWRGSEAELAAQQQRERRIFIIVAIVVVALIIGGGIALQAWRTRPRSGRQRAAER